MNLEDIGYTDWLREILSGREGSEGKAARIVAVDRERFVIDCELGTIPAELTGRLLYSADAADGIPCVGDWVLVDYLDNGSHAIVYELLPRKSILRRRSPGKRVDYQPIAANIDIAFIVQSCDGDYSLNRLDRYLAVANDGGMGAALLLTKSDLVDLSKLESLIEEVRKEHKIDVFPLSNETGAGYDRFRKVLEKGKTYCLIGSSGVGKSTILNRLIGKDKFATRQVRDGDGGGRHTTTRRQMVKLDNGPLFIDTPGMRELGMLGVGLGIEESFQDIAAVAEHCRFANCTHTNETGCAVLQSVADGGLSEERYRSYLKLTKESQYYEMTYLEKRRKDKAFGKMRKDFEKHLREK
jgi:ribosome biogenesis GTPase / thiamine phosphate phosphatase